MKGILFGTLPALLGILLLLSRGEEENVRSGIPGAFDRGAAFLLRHLSRILPAQAGGPGEKRIEGILEKLYPGKDPDLEADRYRREKLSRTLLILGAGSVLALLVAVSAREVSLDPAMIQRPDPGERAQETMLSALLPGGGREELTLIVGERVWTRQEAQEALPGFKEALGEVLLKENPGADAVRGPLDPAEEVEGYPFSVEWMPDPSGLVNIYDGSVEEPDMRTATVLTAKIRYQEEEWEAAYPLTILPPELTAEEELRREILRLTQAAEEETREEDYLELPPRAGEGEIRWMRRSEDHSGLLFCITLLAAVLIHTFADRDLEKKLEERRMQMKEDYPSVVRKLSLYVGAGMTLRSAFEKIASEGEEGRAIYEEMQLACRGMRTGMAEGEAYERFGKRCGSQELIRFSTLLSQNLRKGSSDLLPRLREETASAGHEKLLRARRSAEEAVTKLLVPMVLMLLVVMGMIMIPAFSGVMG